jgi:phospholipid/cholesterol/gamma-HCH transport system substrate-binding protein
VSRGLWLGFVFFCALVVLGFGTLLVGDLRSLFGKTYALDVHFERAPGLRRGDDVRVDGVVFGKVAELSLHQPSGVLVKLRLQEPVVLYADSEIAVEAGSVLGGSAVSIRRGTKEPALDLAQVLPGKTRGGFEEIGELASENRENFKQLIANLKDVTQALKDGKGTIGKAISTPQLHDEAVAAIKDARGAIAEMKKTGETAQAEIKRLGDSLAKITEKVEKGQGPVPALLNDAKMTERVDKTLTQVESAATNLKSITEKIDKGTGTLGRLVNDQDMGDSLKRAVENVEKTSESIRNVSRKLEAGEGTVGKLLQDEELYDRARKVIEDVDKTFGRAARTEVEIVADSKLYESSKLSVTRLGLRLTPSEDKFFFVGVTFLGLSNSGEILFERLFDDGKSDTVTKAEVLLGYRIPWFLDRRLTIRAGMIEGKPGGGVDLRWEDWGFFTHPVEFSFEVRDSYNDLQDQRIDEQIGGPMMRLYAKLPIWTGRASWFESVLASIRLYGGWSRIGFGPDFFGGVGLEWSDEDVRTLVGFLTLSR